jgi:glutaredoxin-related protein
MIKYYGSDKCEACVKILEYMQSTPFEFEYVDVATINFEGHIPRFILDDGRNIVGPVAVKQYVDEWLEEKGFNKQTDKKPVITRWSR